MARITIPIAFANIESDTANRVTWRNLNNGLGLVTAFRTTGVDSWLFWLSITKLALPAGSTFYVTDVLPGDSTVNGQDLSAAWELYESALTIHCDGVADDLVLPGPNHSSNTLLDPSEFYAWRPSEAKITELSTWINAYRALPDAQRDITLTLDDGASVAHTATASPANWLFDLPEAAATQTGVLLVLSDSDDTGLDVVAKALLEASADGTVSTSFFYSDADRGGTDTPLDGELGLGDDESLISGFRRRTTTVLQLNDNDNPVTFDISDYFGTGGDGNDLTIYLQTIDDGEVSWPVAGNVSTPNAGQVRFTIPTDAQTLLDNLADGDRWIFKAARPAAVPVDHTVTASPANWTFDLPEATATRTGTAPVDHTATASPVSWTFELPEAAATRTGVGPVDHTATASPANWLFYLPEAATTSSGVQPMPSFSTSVFRDGLPSYIFTEAEAVLVQAAAEIGPTASDIAVRTAELVADTELLVLSVDIAIGAIADVERIERLAFRALEDLDPVPLTTANRRIQAENQTALVQLVRGLAAAVYAGRAGTAAHRDRTQALAVRNSIADAIDASGDTSATLVFRAFRELKAAVVDLTEQRLRELPRVVTESPSTVLPSLVLAYSIYEDIDRAGEIVGRNVLERPGFVPARPIEITEL